jgi:hypothetical protein
VCSSDLDAAMKEAIAFNAEVKSLPDLKTIRTEVLADGPSIEKAYGAVIARFPDGQVLLTNVGVYADQAGIKAAKAKIDEIIPKDKQIEIQAKLDAEKIKGQADIIQKAIEWKAKLDIAGVEANAKIVEATFKSIDNTITSTGTTLSSLVGSFADLQGKGGTSFIEEQVRQENLRRDAALEMQKSLTQAQVENIKARTQLMERGDAIITIDGKGLAPHLEAMMFAVLSAIKVRVNEEYGDFLVGIT